jgi:predicted permease
MLADLGTAIRQLLRAPSYALVVVATLGLGIGGVTAVFTLADPMVFRPLPYVDSDRIVEVRARTERSDAGGVHADDFVAIAGQAKTLDAVSTLTGPVIGRLDERQNSILGGGVSADFFRLTGLQPILGRVFTAEEYDQSAAGPPRVALLTWPFWQRVFGGADSVVGSRLELSGFAPPSMEIVGVLPREFFYPGTLNEAPAFIVPGTLNRALLGRSNAYPTLLARVRPEFTFAQAEAEIDLLFASVERSNPTFPQGRRARLMPLQDVLFSSIRTPLVLLFIATACVLALALVNLTHLAQARAAARAREMAVRAALGANRWRVGRMLVAEALLLGALGAVAGVVIGQVLYAFGEAQTPRFGHVYRLMPASLNLRVVGLAAAMAMAATLAIGMLPVWTSNRADLRSGMAVSRRRRFRRLGAESLAIAGQTAFAVGLVVTCLLAVRSFTTMVTLERGFDPTLIRLVDARIPDAPSATAALAQSRRLADALAAVPGVAATAIANGVPGLTLPEGVVDAAGGSVPIRNVTAYRIGGRFVDAMGMRLREGRLIDDSEAFGGLPVAVVDEGAAAIMWPGQSALGQTVRVRSGRTFTVVGVLGRVRTSLSSPETARGTVLLTLDPLEPPDAPFVIIRRDQSRAPRDAELAAAAEAAVPGIVWRSANPLTSWERVLGQPRFLATALGTLAALTMALAAFGTLGVVSHFVARRTRELGIRLALGAGRARVRRLVVARALAPAFVGVVAGLGLAYWWSAAVRAAIVGISPRDPWSFAAASALTLALVVAASLRPAFRASRIDPATMLRAE